MPKFGWKAVYEDGVIRQFPPGGKETLYNDVKAKGLPVRFFVGNKYGVNLKTGELLIKGIWTRIGNQDGESFKPTALIYFRRNQVKLAMEMPSKAQIKQVWHFAGYLHATGMVRICIPDDGSKYTICVGDTPIDEGHLVR